MKKAFNWISGFFSSESGTSSKRLVGITGAFILFFTLYKNPTSDSLVWGAVSIICIALGLTTIESVTSLIKGFKGTDTKKEEQ
jgi:hypothetical protein